MSTYRIINKAVQANCIAMVSNLPLDGSMEVVIREYKKISTNEQRRRMFGFVVAEIAEQAEFNGRKYPTAVWHEVLKEKFLPNSFIPGITREGYVKYIEMPNGSLKIIGSTKQLTTRGHMNYVLECEAWAAQELGVKFSASPL